MSTNKGKPFSASKKRPSRVESEEEEARLDALIPARPIYPLPMPSTPMFTLPFRLDTTIKSTLPSKLDTVRRDTLPSKRHTTIKSTLPSRLDTLHRENRSSKRDTTGQSNIPSNLDGSKNEDEISTKTAFRSQHDIEMATRQTKYESLTPQEQKKQEEWAQEKIQTLGPCPQGFRWSRIPCGYHCQGGAHWMSDEMLAEGKGGFFILDDSTPYWMQKSGSNRLTYGGSMLEIFYIIQAAEQLGFSDGLEGFLGPYYSLREAAQLAVPSSARIQRCTVLCVVAVDALWGFCS